MFMITCKKQTRMTTQRKIILEELSKVYSHPTADEIYTMVRERLPNISLGTVYRNLELLAESGQILKLESAGSTRRYDANIIPHYHIRCVACGSVGDMISEEKPYEFVEKILVNGYTLLGVNIAFDGICPKCKQNSKVSIPTNKTIIYEKELA